MRICLISNARLPVRLYGGTERIVQWLAQEYLRAGHEVTLVARSGSRLAGVRFIPADSAAQALERLPADADIYHFHAWPPPDDFPRPWLFTLHGNAAPGERLPARTIGISADHARRHRLPVYVYNGVDPSEFEFRADKQDHLLFFSKVRRRVKGAARALRLARANHLKLTVAGGYRLDLLKTGGLWDSLHPSIRFAGEVGGARKARMLAEASALLFPIAWDEPFGLVLVEALISGTPVIATPRGSVPELVPEGVGATFERDEDFPAALERVRQCRPGDCRDWAMEHFSSVACARRHLGLYARVLDRDVF
ncbi:glycosyltransferase [Ramlibacter sp. AW1]|uniref:Glycosyltransferase n=1 Tax=Ramlibacter aurantiacus TaxID=2801330 RepID=A0A936ZQN3_9BURK|nr:glycosyltransferase [Ramlibacter aurantiacus]MBL0418919.1 glycosyltransferase [Ramlibacter aurantiacus]